MMEKKIRVIVCGTTFGQFYLEALQRLKERFEIVGILARGSERSKKCAELYKVPLYTSFESLPQDIDLACVILRSSILGGPANDFTQYFLERGIHVLQELPIHPKDLEGHYRLARKKQVCFYIGNFYMQLPQVQKFIAYAKALNAICTPAYIQMSFATQVSYPAITMLMQLIPSIRNLNLKCVSQNEGPFQIITGTIDQIPITIQVQNETDPNDPDSNMYLFQSFSIIYTVGRLVMEDPTGPIYWYPKMDTSINIYKQERIQRRNTLGQSTCSKLLGNYEPSSFEKVMTEIWPKAIGRDLLDMALMMKGSKGDLQKVQQDLLGARQWNEINKLIGFPRIITSKQKIEIQIEQLEASINACLQDD